nr:MAG TPA: Triple gene block 3 [Caudoviricetes sp.]
MYKRLSSAFFEIPVHNQCVIIITGNWWQF